MGLSVENVQIRVSTEQLRAKAEEVSRLAGLLKTSMDNLEQKIVATKSYWIGEAGDLHRSVFNEKRDDIANMLKRLNEHPRDLIAIADVYEGVEREVSSMSQSLDEEVID